MRFFNKIRQKTVPRLHDHTHGDAIDLSWVDEFISNVRPYIFVRSEDQLLIKRPNQAQKLNSTGVKVLKSLLDGKSIRSLLDDIGNDPLKVTDVANFLIAVRQELEGNFNSFSQNPAVEIQPFEMKFSQYPVLSEVALTYRCNLKCAFCYAGSGCTKNPTGVHREMTTQEIKTILWKIYHQAKVPSVSFTGGEPTLLADLPELIEYAKHLGMRVNLITNGTLITQSRAKTYADHGLDSAQVSLEGVTSATHDGTVGLSGAFMATLSAITHLKQAGIFTHTNTTLSRANLHECTEFPGFIKETIGNDKFSMNLMIPAGSGAVHDDLIVRYRETGSAIQAIQSASKKAQIEFMWYSPVPMCMFNSIVQGLGNKGCAACDGLLSIGANGEVLPCASYDDPIGSLLSQDFSDIWQSSKARMYRDKSLAHLECRSCDNFAICNGACPLYWRKMGFQELEDVFSKSSVYE